MILRRQQAVLWASASVSVVVLGVAAAAQDAVSEDEAIEAAASGVETALSPQPRPGEQVVPLTSRFILNGVTLDYASDGFLSSGFLADDDGEVDPQLDFTYAFRTSLEEGVEGTLFVRRQTGWYLQLATEDLTRTITTTQETSGEIVGSRLFLTVTGGCLAPDTPDETLCTFTPGLEVDPESVDPDTLLPGRFLTTSEYGDRINFDTYVALQAEGFQRTGPGGEPPIGISLDLANAGFTADLGAPSAGNGIEREETLETRLVFALSHVEQNLYSNDEEAALDRTIRSFALLRAEEWSEVALAFQAAAWFLPAFDARLAPGPGEPNLSISNNLFFSANNLRLPADSYTAFQTGLSWVPHPDGPVERAEDTPVAWSKAVWLGFSPVREVRRSSGLSFDLGGPRRTVASEYTEGGLGGGWEDILAGDIRIIDVVDGAIDDIDFADIDELYVQAGADVTRQDAVRILVNEEVWSTLYVPHLSFTGNRTSGTTVLRAFAGVMLPPDGANAYVGADYTIQEDAWTAFARLELYTEPDEDYYSVAEGSLTRRFTFEDGRSASLGFRTTAELERPEADGQAPRLGDGETGVDLLATYTLPDVDFALRQRLSDLDGDGVTASTTIAATWRATPRLTLTAEHTPFSEEDSYVWGRAGLAYAISDEPTAPTVRVQWARAVYDYGTDEAGRSLETAEQSVLASFQMRF